MSKKLIAILGACLLTSGLGMNAAWAEDHKTAATEQAMVAAESGKKGDAAACAEKAGIAKTHAEAAQAEKPNPHLTAGIKNLNEAIDLARKGQADQAGEAADAAATHLKAAEKAF